MSQIYFMTEHGKLSESNFSFVFSDGKDKQTVFFPHDTDGIVISSKISVTGHALDLLAKEQIPVIFTHSNFKFKSKLDYGNSENILLRIKQYEISCNKEFALSIAKKIVTSKIRNQLAFIRRITRKINTQAKSSVIQIKDIQRQIERANSIDVLRGLEGLASREYFSIIKDNINPQWAQFPCRSQHPPKTNVNAVLSFLYTILAYRIEAAAHLYGLDATLGFLHANQNNRASLVLDLIEEFRTPIADAVCCSMFNHKILTEHDFREIYDSVYSEKTIYLTEDGIKKVIAEFEKKLETQILYLPIKQRISFKKIIFEQVKQFKKVILGEEREYHGFVYK